MSALRTALTNLSFVSNSAIGTLDMWDPIRPYRPFTDNDASYGLKCAEEVMVLLSAYPESPFLLGHIAEAMSRKSSSEPSRAIASRFWREVVDTVSVAAIDDHPAGVPSDDPYLEACAVGRWTASKASRKAVAGMPEALTSWLTEFSTIQVDESRHPEGFQIGFLQAFGEIAARSYRLKGVVGSDFDDQTKSLALN